MNGRIKKSVRVVWAVFAVMALLVQMLAPAAAYAGGGGGGFGGGTGTKLDPYIISSEAHLQEMAAKINNPATNAAYGPAYYKLAEEITMTPPVPDGSNHTPIGTAANQFTGNFDGNENVIRGLVFKHFSTAGENFGLFGYVGIGGVVRYLGVFESSVEGNINVGGIAGYNAGTIEGCSFDGSVKGHASNVGGIAGYNVGDIIESGFSGTVSSSSFAVGGIAGCNTGTVEYSGFISPGSVSGLRYVGGIVGDNDGEINSCDNAGEVKGLVAHSHSIGGVAGRNRPNGFIRYSSNSGNVYGPDLIGGVAGENDRGLIEYSYNIGNVSGLNDPYSGTGGIVGGSWGGTIQYCYNQGAVSGIKYVGGLVGDSGANIRDSFNLGSVTGTDYVGGLVGSSYDGSITRSYAVGAVTSTGAMVGGLVGENWENKTTITSSYYDSETTGQDDTGKGEPKTTAEMKTQATFAGWDFTYTWVIVNTATHWSYPYLMWFGYGDTEAPGYGLKPPSGGGYSEYQGADGNTYYFVDNGDGTATITGLDDSDLCSHHSTDITVPGTVDELTVTKIGENAFRGIGLTRVTIPASVTEIGASAFEGNLLTEVIIPASVTSIGQRAFSANQLEGVTIYNSAASIANDAFNDNQSDPEDLIIYGYEGSTAEDYAGAGGHTFVTIASGDGSENNPYLISSASNLVWMSLKNEAADGFQGKHFKLTADIDLSTVLDYQPIGNEFSVFKGKFDGNNKTISNLRIGDSDEPASFSYTGLFGYVYQGEIKDLTLKDVEIYCTFSHAGGLVGRIAGGLISNVQANGSIEVHENGSAGGLIGAIGMEESAGETRVTKSNSDVEVFSEGDAGGFVGRVESEEATIDTCVATGAVIGGNNAKVGGFVGGNLGTILNSSASGNVTGGSGGLTHVGGFAGENGGLPLTIKNCFARGNVTGGDNALVGGFVGFNDKRIQNAYSTGSVSGGANTHLGGFAVVNYFAGELINTYHNSTAFTEAVKLNKGSITSSAGIIQANMTAAANQPGALVDILNANRVGNTDWLQWTRISGKNDNYPVFGISASPPPAPESQPDPTPSPPPAPGMPIMLNGQTQQQAAIASTQNQNGRTVTTVTLDTQKIIALVNAASIGSTVTVPVNNAAADVVVGQLSGDLVKAMENREAVIEIKTNNASYTLPARQINIDAVLAQLGQDVKLSDVKLNIEIANATGEMARIVEDSAAKGSFAIVVPPLSFTVKATYGDKTLNISRFDSYVERTVAIPDGVDPSKITTGIVVEPDGTVRHVPTQIIVNDGKYYAKINSLTNSVYSVIWNPVQFKDVEGHWAKEAVNDMGSRLVISGIGNNLFVPDRDITRAEFAAIMVRALGLKAGTGANPFTDVSSTAWYRDYIKTAAEYKLISGYGDGRFGPDDKITREQAMAIAARVMNITGLKAELANGEREKLPADFADAAKAADYARNSIAACIKTGIVSGRGGNLIAPKDNITRAEVAVIVQRLLQKSSLI